MSTEHAEMVNWFQQHVISNIYYQKKQIGQLHRCVHPAVYFILFLGVKTGEPTPYLLTSRSRILLFLQSGFWAARFSGAAAPLPAGRAEFSIFNPGTSHSRFITTKTSGTLSKTRFFGWPSMTARKAAINRTVIAFMQRFRLRPFRRKQKRNCSANKKAINKKDGKVNFTEPSLNLCTYYFETESITNQSSTHFFKSCTTFKNWGPPSTKLGGTVVIA